MDWITLGSAVPLAIAANLLNPKVQTWWTITSVARRQARIAALRKEISIFSGEDTALWRFECLTKGLYEILAAFIELLVFVCQGVGGIFGAWIIVPFLPVDKLAAKHPLAGYVVVAGSLYLLVVLYFYGRKVVRVVKRMNDGLIFLRTANMTLANRYLDELKAELVSLVDNSAELAETPIKPPTSQK